MSGTEALRSSPLAPWQRAAIAAAALAFVTLTVWQVAAQRDDWPLSSFEMYSGLQGRVASRSLVKGVSDDGEYDLNSAQLGPFGGARLRHLSAKLARNPRRQTKFLSAVQARYEAHRQSSGAPPLQALRAYHETWRIRPRLEGIDRPQRRMTGSTYLPPPALLSQLELERSGQAMAPVARARGDGDQVLELSPAACVAACADVDDATASNGAALELGDGGKLEDIIELGAGTWRLFVRMKTPQERQGADTLSVTFDGKRVSGKSGIGHYRRWLGDGAWVWASAVPGEPAVTLKVPRPGSYTLKLYSKDGPVRVDQVWLARSRRELPIFNHPIR